MVLKITKKTWGKCGIKTVNYYNEKEDINELRNKMSSIEIQLRHSNIYHIALKGIRKYCGRKTLQKKKKKNIKRFFEGEIGIFIVEKLTRDIIERCKLPEPIELRKILGYNHDDIMIREEASLTEKIIKLFPKENIELNKKFSSRKPDIWFKDHDIIIEVDEGNHENYDSNDEAEGEDMFKKHDFKLFDVIQMILILIFLNF